MPTFVRILLIVLSYYVVYIFGTIVGLVCSRYKHSEPCSLWVAGNGCPDCPYVPNIKDEELQEDQQ